MSKRSLALLSAEAPPVTLERPRTRGDCGAVPRPCPLVGCAHHLYLDVVRRGSLKLNFPDLEPGELETPSCVLDVADAGGATIERVGELLNVTRERARQIEQAALSKLAEAAPGLLRELLSAYAEGRRR